MIVYEAGTPTVYFVAGTPGVCCFCSFVEGSTSSIWPRDVKSTFHIFSDQATYYKASLVNHHARTRPTNSVRMIFLALAIYSQKFSFFIPNLANVPSPVEFPFFLPSFGFPPLFPFPYSKLFLEKCLQLLLLFEQPIQQSRRLGNVCDQPASPSPIPAFFSSPSAPSKS